LKERSLSPIDDFSVQPIDQRLDVLKKRQRHLMIWFILTCTLVVVTVASLVWQKEFIYRFFDLSTHVQALDLPYHVQELVPFKQPVDYFFNLLSWFGWLFLKIFVSLVGAFVLVGWVKKFKFFQQRFQAWSQRILAWVIAFILLWSGLSYLQYNWKDETEQAYQQWMSYQNNIVESQIAQDLQQANISANEKAYVLAQVALLHQPVDRNTANIYVNQLINSEKSNPVQFKQYDFKPEQLWVMQQQLYGKSITSITQPLDLRAQQAERISQIVKVILCGLMIVAVALSTVLYVLAKSFKNRRVRIIQKLDAS
jgi:signal transduction histidine kinase